MWVGENISSGEEYVAEGPIFNLYGSEGAGDSGDRIPSDVVSESPDSSGPKDRDWTPRRTCATSAGVAGCSQRERDEGKKG